MSKAIEQQNFEEAVKTMIRYVGEDVNREGLEKTPNRVLKAYEFMFGGYQEDPQEILNSAMFASSNDEMVLIKDIEFYSTCEHHLLPIIGRAHVAYIPDGKVVGLSCPSNANPRAAYRTNCRCIDGSGFPQRSGGGDSGAPHVYGDARRPKNQLNDDFECPSRIV